MSPTAPLPRMCTRFALAALLLVLAAVAAAPPAAAHGGGGGDATNWRSEITSEARAGLRWRVIGGDNLLELRNTSGREVTVPGYRGEPYLRFLPDRGVLENRRSPAVALNQDRLGRTDPPDGADPEAPPEWRQVADGDSFSWHDHRIHWMSAADPRVVDADRSRTHEVLRWQVPYQLAADDGAPEEGALSGRLLWEPPPPWWPWVAAGLVLVSLPLLAAVGSRPAGARWPRLARPVTAVLLVIVGAEAVHVVDDLTAVPASSGEAALTAVSGGLVVLLVAGLAWRASRADAAGFLALGTAGAVLALNGKTHAGVLTSSTLATGLPEGFTRLLVAASICAVVPAILAAVLAERRFGTFFGRLRPDEHELASSS